MTREQASDLLNGAKTSGEAVAAFRALSKTCHPDGPTPDLELWSHINRAKIVLTTPTKCAACKGAGRITLGNIRTFCKDCNGKGSYV